MFAGSALDVCRSLHIGDFQPITKQAKSHRTSADYVMDIGLLKEPLNELCLFLQ